MTVILPEGLVAEVGVKVEVKDVLCPVVNVRGRVASPEMVYPLPDVMTLEIVALPVPLFVRDTVCELLEPTKTFPKLTPAGLGVI